MKYTNAIIEMKKVICWWSGGVTSAVACKIALDLYGVEKCDVIMIDTHNEDEDTYRFKADCERWYNKPIRVISAIGETYASINDVWERHLSLNVANGAICSSKLKRAVREKYQKENGDNIESQVFGFEFEPKEFNRAKSMRLNHPTAMPIFPLLMFSHSKSDCIDILYKAGITVPRMYRFGFKNNNCFKTGCVQGGIGYWQKMQNEFPDKFDAMADIEHKLTNIKGTPVTMLKDQSSGAKEKIKECKYANLVFLKKHPNYPQLKCIDDMPKCKVEPLFECNGYCGVNDLNRSNTEAEINFEND